MNTRADTYTADEVMSRIRRERDELCDQVKQLAAERDDALQHADKLQESLDDTRAVNKDLATQCYATEEHLQDALKDVERLTRERDDAVNKVKHLLHLPENPGEYTAENGFSKSPQKAAPVIHFDIPVMGALEMILQALREQPPQE